MVLAWLVLHFVCCGARSTNVTLFITKGVYLPPRKPDEICSTEGRLSDVMRINNASAHLAVFFMSYRSDLRAMFNGITNFTNERGEQLATSSRALFYGLNSSIWYDSQNPTMNDVDFWTGAATNEGNLVNGNCADFTAPGTCYVGNFFSGISNRSSTCYSQSTARPFLCAAFDEQPAKAIIPEITGRTVYLYATESYSAGAGDPDQICLDEARKNGNQNFSNASFQAFFFTAARQSLHEMLANADKTNGGIRDLDGNLIAMNSTQLFTSEMSRINLRKPNGGIFPAIDAFWSGAADFSGSVADANCGDFTNSSSRGVTGKLVNGLRDSPLQECTTPLSFICVANAIPLVPPTPSSLSVYVYLSVNNTMGNISDPDQYCTRSSSGPFFPSYLANLDKHAFLFTKDLFSIYHSQPVIFRDLKNNILANTVEEFYQGGSRRAVAGPDGVGINYDEALVWAGGNSSETSCINFTTAGHRANGTFGSLFGGFRNSSSLIPCSRQLRLLCAVFISASPTNPITSQPSRSPPTSSPTSVPTSFPTALPTKIVSSTNVTYNGSEINITLGGSNATVNVTFPSDSSLVSNGTVQVVVAPSTPNITVSDVVTIVLIGLSGVQDVSNLTNPVRIVFPISVSLDKFEDVNVCTKDSQPERVSTRPKCGYLNVSTDTWKTNGCSTYPINDVTIECRCTHFTDFAVILPKFNDVVPTEILLLSPDNVEKKPTGVIAILIILCLFTVIFALAKRRDWKEANRYIELRDAKQQKWASFSAEKQKRSLWKQIKIDFQKRHTWFSLIFRKSGTSFQSVDRTFVALLSVFASMSMSAHFHAQDNNDLARGIMLISTVCACLLPSQVLTYLFVHTGKMGFFEEFELMRDPHKNRCLQYRFSERWRHVWRTFTALAVGAMVIHVLIMSMRFDLQPFFYCQGAPAEAWVTTWLGAYAVMALGIEPLRILLLAVLTYHCADLISYNAELSRTRLEMSSVDSRPTT